MLQNQQQQQHCPPSHHEKAAPLWNRDGWEEMCNVMWGAALLGHDAAVSHAGYCGGHSGEGDAIESACTLTVSVASAATSAPPASTHSLRQNHSLSFCLSLSLSLWASVCLCKCVRTGFELFLQDVNCWSVKQLEWDGKLSKSRIMPNHQFISSTSTLQNHSLSVCLSVSLSLDLSLAVCVFVCSVFTTFHHPFRTVVLS